MSQPYFNWRCFFWHKWRWVWIGSARDLCVREGCGIVRPHRDGTPPQ